MGLPCFTAISWEGKLIRINLEYWWVWFGLQVSSSGNPKNIHNQSVPETSPINRAVVVDRPLAENWDPDGCGPGFSKSRHGDHEAWGEWYVTLTIPWDVDLCTWNTYIYIPNWSQSQLDNLTVALTKSIHLEIYNDIVEMSPHPS